VRGELPGRGARQGPLGVSPFANAAFDAISQVVRHSHAGQPRDPKGAAAAAPAQQRRTSTGGERPPAAASGDDASSLPDQSSQPSEPSAPSTPSSPLMAFAPKGAPLGVCASPGAPYLPHLSGPPLPLGDAERLAFVNDSQLLVSSAARARALRCTS
jgi:hypothetical protein